MTEMSKIVGREVVGSDVRLDSPNLASSFLAPLGELYKRVGRRGGGGGGGNVCVCVCVCVSGAT